MPNESTVLQFIDMFPQFFHLDTAHAVSDHQDRLDARLEIYDELNFSIYRQSK